MTPPCSESRERFIENDVGSVEELEGSDELMGKFLLASHSKVKLRPYYNMRKFLQKDLRNAPPPPPIRNPLPPLLGREVVTRPETDPRCAETILL